MKSKTLGKVYPADTVVIRQGERGNCMYVIQDGHVSVSVEDNGEKVDLAELETGDFFGEMALFGTDIRSATIKTKTQCRILTIDRKNLIQRTLEDPTLMLHIVETLARRIRDLNAELVKLNRSVRQCCDSG